MLGWKSNHVSERGPWWFASECTLLAIFYKFIIWSFLHIRGSFCACTWLKIMIVKQFYLFKYCKVSFETSMSFDHNTYPKPIRHCRFMMTSSNGSISASLVDSLHWGQWHVALMFSLICTWTNVWANNQDARDLRCHMSSLLLSIRP